MEDGVYKDYTYASSSPVSLVKRNANLFVVACDHRQYCSRTRSPQTRTAWPARVDAMRDRMSPTTTIWSREVQKQASRVTQSNPVQQNGRPAGVSSSLAS
jgi:predicted acylesterase/phospholipase RssA